MVRKLPRIKRIEEHRLSDGGLAIINVYNRKYSFCRIFPSDLAPDDAHGLTKDQAYEMLAECLKKDVLDIN